MISNLLFPTENLQYACTCRRRAYSIASGKKAQVQKAQILSLINKNQKKSSIIKVKSKKNIEKSTIIIEKTRFIKSVFYRNIRNGVFVLVFSALKSRILKFQFSFLRGFGVVTLRERLFTTISTCMATVAELLPFSSSFRCFD